MWALQAGTAVSTRVRADAGNSVNIIRLGASAPTLDTTASALRHCLIERWDHTAINQCFERVQTLSLSSAHSICAPGRPDVA